MATFGQELVEYLKTIVPFWRVSDDAWPIGNGNHLTGTGVLRNHGGAVLVIPWGQESGEQLLLFRELLEPLARRIIVIVDDRSTENLQVVSALLAPIVVLELTRFRGRFLIMHQAA